MNYLRLVTGEETEEKQSCPGCTAAGICQVPEGWSNPLRDVSYPSGTCLGPSMVLQAECERGCQPAHSQQSVVGRGRDEKTVLELATPSLCKITHN